jgi:hypothetical protein
VAHYYFVAMELAVELAVAVRTFDDETAAAAVDAKEDNSFDVDLHDSIVADAAAAYDVVSIVVAHRHHLATANHHHLYSQHNHLDTEVISYSSLSVLLIHHLTVNCNDAHYCKNDVDGSI